MIKSHQEKNQEEAIQAAKLAAGAAIYSNLFGSKKELRNTDSELEDLRRKYYKLKSENKKLKKEKSVNTYDAELLEDDSEDDSDIKKFGMFILNTIKFVTAFVLMSILIIIIL